MGYTKKDVQSLEQPVRTGDKLVTNLLDATTTTQILTLGDVFEKVSFQASDTLAGTVEFSLNGINWVNSTAIGAANAIVSFNTHNVAAIKVTRSAGSGKLHIGCK